ncbi:tRNA dihydrouridine(20/20a) synthase DusA [Buchnera aphidicola (Chaitoregma tattakana)]|uniref:tRNA dihydrouridine(20/20a) synthase DusA n=1 Tax=Buchnera aphidicola TaxID=9 RepID=UPI0031B8923A
MKSIIKNKNDIYRFCVAPMFGYTDKYCRKIYRIISKKSSLFTEMITAQNLFNKNHTKFIKNRNKDDPIIIQIAGSDKKIISKYAEIAYKKKYNYINLNIGCPSIRAQKGNFGAILMKQPNIIIDIINKISENTPLEISIKTRIGINKYDNYEFLKEFIHKISTLSTCKVFILHARKAILKNCSTRKNLKIPKIKHNIVYKIKKEFPKLKIILNGEIKSIEESLKHLKKVDGVMLGRSIYNNPMLLRQVDNKIYNTNKKVKFKNILKKIFRYIDKEKLKQNSTYKLTRHILHIFKNTKGSSMWKKLILSRNYIQTHSIKKIFNKIKKYNSNILNKS